MIWRKLFTLKKTYIMRVRSVVSKIYSWDNVYCWFSCILIPNISKSLVDLSTNHKCHHETLYCSLLYICKSWSHGLTSLINNLFEVNMSNLTTYFWPCMENLLRITIKFACNCEILWNSVVCTWFVVVVVGFVFSFCPGQAMCYAD